MKKLKYEKPRMNKVDLACNRSVAAQCWGGAEANGSGTEWYYDTTGAGYIKFTLKAGNCSGVTSDNIMVIEYCKFTSDTAKYAAKQELDTFITNIGPNGGSPWKDKNTNVTVPTSPAGMS